MAILLTGTTIGGHSAIHAGNLATHGIITTSNIGSYAITSIPTSFSSITVTSSFDTASNDIYASMRVIRNNSAITDGMYIGYGNSGSGITRIFGGGSTTGALVKATDYTYEPGSFRAPIFYDSDNTTYYFDGNSTTSLRTRGSWRSDSSDWDGEYAGKIQYHSNHWYFQSGNLWLFRNAGGANVFQVDQSGNGTFNGDIYLGTRGTWLSSYLNQDVRTSASPSFSTVNLNTLNASDTNARYYVQSTNGVPSNNLGSPTVTEMALFDEQFNNKTAFYDNTALSFWTSSDGVNFTEYTGFDTTIKKRFLGGDLDSGVFIPNLTNRFRIELENTQGYVFLNQLYIYWSSNSHSTKVHIWVRRCDNNQWYQWTDSNTQVSSWPGHLYLPFSGIPFYPGALASNGHYNRIRIEFIPSWSGHAVYGTQPIYLMRMQIWGGYPAGKRNIYSTDENRNVTFPTEVGATAFYATDFRAANAFYLNGTSYYLNSSNGGIYTNARFETAGNLVVGGNSYLGNGNGDEVHINDILRVGATDSGDAHFYFGEGSLAGSDYGMHWYWDSGVNFYWYGRNAASDTLIMNYTTNDNTYVKWHRHFHMNNYEINYTGQLHFNGNTRFVNNGANYLNFQIGSDSYGSIQVRDNSSNIKGYLGYFDANGFGLLNSGGSWGIRLNPGSAETLLFYAGNEKFRTDGSGVYVTGRLDVSDYIYTPQHITAKNIQGSYQVLNLDTIKAPGLYQYDGGIGGTQPLGTDWYNVKTIEIGSGGRYSQFVMPYQNNRIFYRSQVGGTWLSYVELISSENIGSQSVSYANSAGSLTSMNISQFTNNSGYITSSSLSSYLPLAGGTMTGQIYGSNIGTGTYDGLIQVRETGYVTTSQSDWGYAPGITYHWGGRVSSKVGIRSDGLFAIDNEPFATRSWVNGQGFLTSVPAQSQLISPNGGSVVAADAAMPNAGHSFIHSLALGPGGNDGHILGMTWAGTTSSYGAQIFIDTDPNDILAIRSRSSGGVWTSWKTVYHTGNFTNNSSNWDTAYSWGNHASAGYLTGAHNHDDRYYTESESDGRYAYKAGAAGQDFSADRLSSYYLRNHYGVSTDHSYGMYFDNGLSSAYGIYRESGAWDHPYPDLRIAFHTGIKLGANSGYNGIRFYTDYDMTTQVMSVNNGSDGLGGGNVYVNNSLQAGSSLRAPIFYDSQDTNYYVDPNSSSKLSSLGLGGISPDARLSVSGDTHISGYIYQGGNAAASSSWGSRTLVSSGNYTTNANTFRFDNLGYGTTWDVRFDSSGAHASHSFRAPIFYDSNDTNYYGDFAGFSYLNQLGLASFQYIGGQTSNGQSNYQWDGADYRDPNQWTARLILRRDNATTGINGSIPSLVIFNNNGANQTTASMVFATNECVTGSNSVNLAGIIAKKESVGNCGGWSAGSLNFFVKNFGARVDSLALTPDGNATFSGIVYSTGYGNSSQWNTAYSWGNHASAGYQSASTAITTSNIGSQSVSYASTAGSLSSMNISQFTNNSGYLTGITSGQVTGALGYTPYNSSNPSGYITSSGSISGNAATATYATTAGSAPNGSNINQFYNVSAGVGNGLSFWNGSSAYKISMGVGSLYQYGPVSDYSIKMQMNDGDTGRGFTWGRESYAPIAALNSTSGDMEVAGYYKSYGYRGNGNVGGTGTASWHPDGIYCGSTMWQYGTMYKNNTGIYDVSEFKLNAGPVLGTYNTRNLIVKAHDSNDVMGILGQKSGGGFAFQIYGDGTNYGFLDGSWAGWDIKKTVDGAMYMNDDNSYYLYTNSESRFNTFTTAGSVVIGGTFANNPYNAVGSTRLLFGGGNEPNNYFIGTNMENYGGNYTKLDLRWHTGIRMGAQPSYGGIRFFNNETLGSRIMSIGEGDANIRIDNNLWIGGAGGWITDLLNAKQNASTAITTSNIGSQSVSYASSAGSVAWTNVSSRPTALSQFTNDLGNYGGWITSSGSISGNAATATNVAWSGVTSKPAAWLDGGAMVQDMEPSATAFPSGFYQSYLGAGNPTGTWFNYINVRHSNTGNGHGFQLGMSYYDTNLWFRSYQGGTSPSFSAWNYAIHSGNIGSQSVNYANSAGSATSATNAGQLNTYGYLVGENWNDYYTSGKLRVASVAGSTSANCPSNVHNYGGLLSYGIAGEDSFQLYFPDNAADSIANSRRLHYRTGRNGGWSSWRTVVDMVGDTLTIVEGPNPKIVVRGSAGYGSPSSASIELVGDADGGYTQSYRWISNASDWAGQEFRLERKVNNSFQLVGRVPKNTNNLEWQGTIVQGLSDSRVKSNVVSMTGGLDKIDQIRPVTFDWVPTEDVSDREGADFGFIAQELEEVLPEVVHTRGDGYKTVMYEKVVPVLVQAMKEQQAMIDALKAEIELLKNK